MANRGLAAKNEAFSGAPPARVRVAPDPAAPPADRWTRPATRWVAMLVATGLIAYLCWLMLAPFVDVLLWAVVLVVVFHPVHRRLARRMKWPSLAAALSCLLVIVAILLPLALVTLAVVRDATVMAHAVGERKEEFLDPNPRTAVGRALLWVDRYLDVNRVRSQEYLAERASAIVGRVAARTLNVVGGMVGVVVQIFFVIFAMFYLFRDGERLMAGLGEVLPLEQWQAHEVFVRTKEVIHASIYGSLVIATIQGTLGGLAFWVLGVPSPLLWGAVMILPCTIPMAGAFLVWVPAALYLLLAGKWPHAVALTAWGALVISSIDNILRPKLVGGRAHMHELAVFFAVLGGIHVFGVLGIITGPAVAAVAMALVEVWKRWRAGPVTEAAGTPATSAAAGQPAPGAVVAETCGAGLSPAAPAAPTDGVVTADTGKGGPNHVAARGAPPAAGVNEGEGDVPAAVPPPGNGRASGTPGRQTPATEAGCQPG